MVSPVYPDLSSFERYLLDLPRENTSLEDESDTSPIDNRSVSSSAVSIESDYILVDSDEPQDNTPPAPTAPPREEIAFPKNSSDVSSARVSSWLQV